MNQQTIWVERDSYHTAIIVSTDVVRSRCGLLDKHLTDAAFSRFGWGDRDYYGSSQKTLWKLFKALFLPTRAVMEVTQFKTVAEAGNWIVALTVNESELMTMLDRIADDFCYSESNEICLLRTEKTDTETQPRYYYCAKGVYFIFYNCNNWTAKRLITSGVDLHYFVSLYSRQLMKKLEAGKEAARIR